jgi:hypothetical protein
MFRRLTLLSTFVFCIFAAIWVFRVCIVRPDDILRYKAFVKEQEVATTSKKNAVAADQKRLGVRKDIWFTQEDKSRLHYRIESQSSTLTLIPVENKLEIIENLDKIKCGMQEKLFVTGTTPTQQLRFLEADQGIYRYSTQQFIAESVTLSLYRLPGHQLPSTFDNKTPFLKGISQNVSFAISGKSPQFQAQHFQAFLRNSAEGS